LPPARPTTSAVPAVRHIVLGGLPAPKAKPAAPPTPAPDTGRLARKKDKAPRAVIDWGEQEKARGG
jgi:hypothetical protein